MKLFRQFDNLCYSYDCIVIAIYLLLLVTSYSTPTIYLLPLVTSYSTPMIYLLLLFYYECDDNSELNYTC